MGKNYFIDEQVQQLQLNPYVKNVSNKAITYTDEFKVVFTEKYLQGNPPSVILRGMGFDPHILGKKRIDRFVGNVYKSQDRMAMLATCERNVLVGLPRRNSQIKNALLAWSIR